MATQLGKIVADFTSQLATAMAVGATTATLQSATDDDGVALPSGRYFFTIDGDSVRKEHISCSLSGTSLTNIKSVSRQGAETTGTARLHKIGATVTITDFAHIKYINDLLDGTTNLNASEPLEYDATATINADNQLATKAYVDGVAVAGAPNATTTAKGIVELATQAEHDARTATGGTGASLVSTPALNRAVLMHDYAASSAGSDTYAITLTPAPTAYTTGDVYFFKADVANTGACTLNVNSLGAKTIKRLNGDALIDGDILANAIVQVVYNGTDMLLMGTDDATRKGVQNSSYTYGASSAGSDTYAITLTPAPTAYATGQIFTFYADVANTGTATLNVNGLGAKTLKTATNRDLVTGDILAGGMYTVVYDGTNFQLQSTANKTYLIASGVNLTSSTANTSENTLIQIPINGNTLGSTGAYKLIMYVVLSTNSGGITIRTKYGATTCSTLTPGSLTTANWQLKWEFICHANASTSSQYTVANIVGGTQRISQGPTADNFQFQETGTATENSTTDLNLTLTTQVGSTSNPSVLFVKSYEVYAIK